MLLVWSVAVEQIGELGKDGEYQSAAIILIGFAIWKKNGTNKGLIHYTNWFVGKENNRKMSIVEFNEIRKKKILFFAPNALH